MTAATSTLSHPITIAGALLASGLSPLAVCIPSTERIPGAVVLPPFMPTPSPTLPQSDPFSHPRRPDVKQPRRLPSPNPTPVRFSQAERDELIEHNFCLVESLVSQLYQKCGKLLRGLERDDLIQEGRIGLIQAVDSFNPEKGVFKTHAYRCIKDALSDCLAANGRQTKLFEQVLGDVEDHSPLHDETVGRNLNSDLRHALSTLDERSRDAVLLHVVDGHSKAEVARRLGMTRQGCTKLIDRALLTMRAQMEHFSDSE